MMTTKTRRSTNPIDPIEAAADALVAGADMTETHTLVIKPSNIRAILTDIVTAAREAEHHNARLAIASEHLLPSPTADLDLLEHLVCSCTETPCPRRDVVARLRARIEATEALARTWKAEAAERSTPTTPDTLLAAGAADRLLHALGVPKEDR